MSPSCLWGKLWPLGRGGRVCLLDQRLLWGDEEGQVPPELDGVRTTWRRNSVIALLAPFHLGPTGHLQPHSGLLLVLRPRLPGIPPDLFPAEQPRPAGLGLGPAGLI